MGYRGQKNWSLTVAALSGVALLTTLIITKRHDHLFVAKRRGDAQANSAPLQSQVINPTPDTHRSPNTLVFLSSHFQNSSRWLRTASILSAQGYQCHLVHLGLGNISKSLVALREYVESIDSQNGTSRVVLFGHRYVQRRPLSFNAASATTPPNSFPPSLRPPLVQSGRNPGAAVRPTP